MIKKREEGAAEGKRPRVIIYNGVSLDGRIDGFVPDLELYYGLVPRWGEDATLIGSGTILEGPGEVPLDEAGPVEPPAQDPNDRRPLLAIADGRGRVRCWRNLLKQPYWRAGVALCCRATPEEHLEYLARQGIDRVIAGDERVDLRAALEEMGGRFGVKVVRADSGGTLNGSLLRAGLVDEVSLLIHPVLVGGTSPRSMFRAPDVASPEEAIPLRLTHFEQLDNGILWVRYEVVR